jgi:hypothetical protein
MTQRAKEMRELADRLSNCSMFPVSGFPDSTKFVVGFSITEQTRETIVSALRLAAQADAQPFGYLIEKSGINNGYYFHTPAEFEHVEERFRHHYTPVYAQAQADAPGGEPDILSSAEPACGDYSQTSQHRSGDLQPGSAEANGILPQLMQEPVMWACLVNDPIAGEKRMRAWTVKADRAERFRTVEKLNMQPLYAAPQPPQQEVVKDALDESANIINWLLEDRELDQMDRVRLNQWSQLCQKADAALSEGKPGGDGTVTRPVGNITENKEGGAS